MLDFQEAHQVVSLEKHEADEATIELFVAFNLVLELASDVPVELLFVHRQSKSFDHS